jgi:hypothetical protein
MESRITKFVGGFAGLALSTATAWSLPLGDQFRVNEQTAGSQDSGAVAASANGDSVVAWYDSGSSFVQRFDAAGRPLHRGGLRVGSGRIAIALDDAGNLVVVDEAGDGSGLGIFAAIYDRSGAQLVARFRVNVVTAGIQAGAQVAVNGSGEIVISWATIAPDNSTFRPVVRRFRGNGAPVTGEIVVNALTQSVPAVAIDRLGNFVLTYAIDRMGVSGEIYLASS